MTSVVLRPSSEYTARVSGLLAMQSYSQFIHFLYIWLHYSRCKATPNSCTFYRGGSVAHVTKPLPLHSLSIQQAPLLAIQSYFHIMHILYRWLHCSRIKATPNSCIFYTAGSITHVTKLLPILAYSIQVAPLLTYQSYSQFLHILYSRLHYSRNKATPNSCIFYTAGSIAHVTKLLPILAYSIQQAPLLT